jgi:MarR-like DNA-binding transcriptional regulator SgrR of sgrS sRNA
VAGNVDMSFLTDDKTGLTLQELPNLGFGELKSTFLYFALVNRSREDLGNFPWKQLSGRLNRDEMIRQLETTGLEAAVAPVHPEDPWFALDSVLGSNEGSKAISAKRRLSLYYLDLQPIVGRIALLLKRNVSEAGVELDVQQLPPEEFRKKILIEKDFDLVLLPYAIKDALSSNYFVFHSAEGAGSVNLSGYRNLEVDKYLEEARYESDNARAKASFSKAVSAMMEDPPGIFLFWLKTPILYRKSCTGFKFNTNEFFSSLKDVRCEPSAVN